MVPEGYWRVPTKKSFVRTFVDSFTSEIADKNIASFLKDFDPMD